MKNKISIKDIAHSAGVSIATVSYVLSGRKDNSVSTTVAEKIRKLADELGYRPNQVAKSLQSGKTRTIGLIVADIANPFFAQIARQVEDTAKVHGYTVIFGSNDEQAIKSGALTEFLLSRQVDGLIIAPAEGSENSIANLVDRNVPLVLIDRYFPEIPANAVVVDNYKATFNAIKGLVDQGKTRIAMVAYDTKLQHMKDRISGYEEALSESKGNIDLLFKVKHDNTEESVNDVISEIVNLDPPIEGIFFATNTLGIKGIKQLLNMGIKISENMAVIVFDHSEALDFLPFKVTHIRQPLAKVAKHAVELVVQQMDKSNSKNSHIELSTELIIGQSID